MYDAINLGRRIDVVWPEEKMRVKGGRSHWKDWLPEKGMEGLVLIVVFMLFKLNINWSFTKTFIFIRWYTNGFQIIVIYPRDLM